MNTIFIFLGILPLLVFVVVDSFTGLKSALITAVVFALLEGVLSLILLGHIDSITLFSLLLIVALAGVSFYKKTDLHFKLQPVILSIIFGLIFLISFFVNKPLLYIMFRKYENHLPPIIHELILNPIFQDFLGLTSHYLGYAFIAHGLLTLWAALKLSKWWWIAIRGIGFYLFMFIAMFLAKLKMGI